MKNALRDILIILGIFAAIVLAPFVKDLIPEGQPAEEEQPKPAPVVVAPPRAGEDDVPGISAAMDRFKPLLPREESKADAAACAGRNTLEGIGEYNPEVAAGGAGEDSFVVGASDISAPLVPGTMHGSKAGDTLRADGAGTAELDGQHIAGIGVYDIRNRKPNVVNVSAAGLVTLEGGHAVVIGDSGMDTVKLDACLSWNDPILIEGRGEKLLRYDTTDAEGNRASVSVSMGVKVETQ